MLQCKLLLLTPQVLAEARVQRIVMLSCFLNNIITAPLCGVREFIQCRKNSISRGENNKFAVLLLHCLFFVFMHDMLYCMGRSRPHGTCGLVAIPPYNQSSMFQHKVLNMTLLISIVIKHLRNNSNINMTIHRTFLHIYFCLHY